MSKVDRWLGISLTFVALVWLWLVNLDIPDIALAPNRVRVDFRACSVWSSPYSA